MKIVITAATEKEIWQIQKSVDSLYTGRSKRLHVLFHESGVGILNSCFSMLKLIYDTRPDLIMQVGIAGAFNNKTALSKVVAVKEDRIGDCGVEENGRFKDIFDLELMDKNLLPFSNGKLANNDIKKWNFLQLDEVNAITVNEITTRNERIEQLKAKYNPAIETMEGAALHYCCLRTNTSFIQIRAVSNYIGERDKLKWKFKESFDNLTSIVKSYIDHLYSIE